MDNQLTAQYAAFGGHLVRHLVEILMLLLQLATRKMGIVYLNKVANRSLAVLARR